MMRRFRGANEVTVIANLKTENINLLGCKAWYESKDIIISRRGAVIAALFLYINMTQKYNWDIKLDFEVLSSPLQKNIRKKHFWSISLAGRSC